MITHCPVLCIKSLIKNIRKLLPFSLYGVPRSFPGFDAKTVNRPSPGSESFLKGSSLIPGMKFCPHQFVLIAKSHYARYIMYKALLIIFLPFPLDLVFPLPHFNLILILCLIGKTKLKLLKLYAVPVNMLVISYVCSLILSAHINPSIIVISHSHFYS